MIADPSASANLDERDAESSAAKRLDHPCTSFIKPTNLNMTHTKLQAVMDIMIGSDRLR